MCRKGLARHFDADDIFLVTKQGLDFFHDHFDYPYPFGKYDQAFVPEYNIGAMENPGCVTFREEFVFRGKVTQASYERRANVILHEMAHMWFGDLVTMQWWDDLWLKESFADFMGSFSLVEATRFTNGWVTFANNRKSWAYRADQLPSTHPITADIRDLEDAKLNFDGITYAKGASVLKQLVAYVGQDAFLEGARRYFKRHAYGNTRLGDLLSVLAETSGRDMAAWSRSWLQTAGVNSLTPVVTYDAGDRITELAVVQEAADIRAAAAPGGGGPVPARSGGELVRYARAEVDVAGPRTVVDGAGRGGAAGPRAGQRRGPDVLQDPLRRGLAGDAAGASGRHHGPAGAGAVLVGAVESDPGRADAGAGLHRPGAAVRGARVGHRRAADAARVGALGARCTTRRPSGARRAGGCWRRARCASCGWPSRAASTS